MDALLAAQDGVITRKQALAHLSPDALDHRLGREWKVVLPGIYIAASSAPPQRQRLRAALLFAGPQAVLSDTSALRLFGVPYVPADDKIRVLVPDAVQRHSRDFVVIKRSIRMPTACVVGGLQVAPVCRSLCELGQRHPNERESLAVVAAAVQSRLVTARELSVEAHAGPARGRPRLLRVIAPVEAGVRSAPEADFRRIVESSRVLPPPLWNALVELPDGRRFSPDALFVEAGLVHETNGRQFHAPEAGNGVFEDMQRRNDALVAAGFVVLHNSPSRLRAEPAVVRREVEQAYRRNAGRGLPGGVRFLREGPAAA
ncbi:MAG TPA: hypothetical protein VHC43_12315 [Mycobacteriales bacterium]|nr:hypothetical protein [Mycobacteriales bacterium]